MRRHRRSTSLFTQTVFFISAAGFFVFMAVERFPEKVPNLVRLTSVKTIEGTGRVIDGDTIRIEDTSVRLGSLDCPERDTTAGQTATRALSELVQGDTLACFLNGRTSYDRSIGSCITSNGDDVGGAMLDMRACNRFW